MPNAAKIVRRHLRQNRFLSIFGAYALVVLVGAIVADDRLNNTQIRLIFTRWRCRSQS
jgi:hypothetical protein